MNEALPAIKRQFALVWCCGVMLAVAPQLRGAEVVLQNDTVPPGTSLPNFIPGERIAAWFTVPANGDIVGVQIMWGSLFGSQPPSLETAIRVSSSGVFPTPGATLATITNPTLVDMVAPNEFRFLDPPTNSVPLQVPVTAGQVIVVDLEILNQSAGFPTAPSIEYDSDGIQAGVNSVFAGGSWTDASLLGVPGDFGIRAIFDPVPEPGTLLLAVPGLVMLLGLRRRQG